MMKSSFYFIFTFDTEGFLIVTLKRKRVQATDSILTHMVCNLETADILP